MPIFAIGMYLLSFIKFENKTVSTILWNTDCHFFITQSWSDKGEYISKQTRENYVVENINKKNINTAVVSPISQEDMVRRGIWYCLWFYGCKCTHN
jgi:hypothetical protein